MTATLERTADELREDIAELRAAADALTAEGTPGARKRAGVLRCQATKAENLIGFFVEASDIGLDDAIARWCPNGPYRRPAGWMP